MAKQYTVRCVETYTAAIPASHLVNNKGAVVCAVPAIALHHDAGELQSFRKLGDAKKYMSAPNNAGKWELVP